MRVKLYRAADITAAMARIRAELGAEALILSSRRVPEGVEVTAALDTPEPLIPAAPPDRASLLAWHGVPPRLRSALGGTTPLQDLLAAAFRFAPLPLGPADPPLLAVGPPGAGKTLAVARLATRLVLAGATPRVITADGQRAGAIEQLAAFTRLLNLDLLAAATPEAFARALTRARAAGGPVLIDTPGLDPGADPALLASFAAAGTLALVLPAGLDAEESAELAVAFAAAGASFLVATRLDLARRLGGILAAAGSGLALAEAGVGPGAADGLTKMTPSLLAARLEASIPAATPQLSRPVWPRLRSDWPPPAQRPPASGAPSTATPLSGRHA